ncbi:hypothetical protein D3C81_1441740 [compost metagenome]
MERRYRYLRQGQQRKPRRCRRQGQRRPARQRQRAALQGGGRGRQPGHDPAGPGRVRPQWRRDQHRLHRQRRRRGLLRPRGQHQDPAQRSGAGWRHDREAAQPAAGQHDRGSRHAGAGQQLQADPGAVPGGAPRPRADRRIQAADGRPGVAWQAGPCHRVPAVRRATGRAPGGWPRPDPCRAVGADLVQQDRPQGATAQVAGAGRRLPDPRHGNRVPAVAGEQVRRFHASPPSEARDRQHPDRQRPGQQHGHHLRPAVEGIDRHEPGQCRRRLCDRA